MIEAQFKYPIVFLLALSVCPGMSSVVFGAEHRCGDCHTSAAHNVDDLKKPLSALCAECHVARIAAGEHKVDIEVSATENTLPLKDNKLTCVTCHDPHKMGFALRLPKDSLCKQCHKK